MLRELSRDIDPVQDPPGAITFLSPRPECACREDRPYQRRTLRLQWIFLYHALRQLEDRLERPPPQVFVDAVEPTSGDRREIARRRGDHYSDNEMHRIGSYLANSHFHFHVELGGIIGFIQETIFDMPVQIGDLAWAGIARNRISHSNYCCSTSSTNRARSNPMRKTKYSVTGCTTTVATPPINV